MAQQPTIVASTAEAECAALPMALRSAIPFIGLTQAATSGLAYLNERILTFRAAAHEGNQGALKLATLEEGRTTPRSKFYA